MRNDHILITTMQTKRNELEELLHKALGREDALESAILSGKVQILQDMILFGIRLVQEENRGEK